MSKKDAANGLAVADKKVAVPAITRDKKTDIKTATSVDPFLILANHKKNFSRFLAKERQSGNDPKLVSLALDMGKRGNTEPIKVIRINGNPNYEFEVVSGFGRHTAAMMIKNGFTYVDTETEEEVVVEPNELFALKVTLFTGNDKERFQANLGENIFRTDLTDLDKAFAARNCMEIMGLSTSETAQWLDVHPSYVGQLMKLLLLPDKIQTAIATGSVKAATRTLMKITELDEVAQEAFLEQIMGGEKITLNAVNRFIVNNNDVPDEDEDSDETSAEENGEPKPTRTPKNTGLPVNQITNKNLKSFYEDRISPATFPPFNGYCSFMTKERLPGKASDKQHENATYKMLQATVDATITRLVALGLVKKDMDTAERKTFWKQLQNAHIETPAE